MTKMLSWFSVVPPPVSLLDSSSVLDVGKLDVTKALWFESCQWRQSQDDWGQWNEWEEASWYAPRARIQVESGLYVILVDY